ncbi:MAG: sulfite exporter TauE/SafE family protein [Candidatus Doudnabacteria bacterium]|nr:sulfite exporter TauE/SafE family protein [Candidatus Doudnabacteria bacterium]
MLEFFSNITPSSFHLWHLPVIFLTGMIAEGYAVVVGGGGILIQFVLASFGLPLPVVVATDLGGVLGADLGVMSASPRSIWSNKKLIWLVTLPFFVGSIFGSIFLIKISATLLSYLLIAALIFLILYMLVGKNHEPKNLDELRVTLKQYPLLGSIMGVLGLYTNISGVGSGTFMKVAFVSLLRMKAVEGIGVSSIVYLPATFVSIGITAFAGLLVWPYVITLWFGTFVGAYFVATHIQKIPDIYLRNFLIFVAFLYLIYLIWNTLT